MSCNVTKNNMKFISSDCGLNDYKRSTGRKIRSLNSKAIIKIVVTLHQI